MAQQHSVDMHCRGGEKKKKKERKDPNTQRGYQLSVPSAGMHMYVYIYKYMYNQYRVAAYTPSPNSKSVLQRQGSRYSQVD